MAHGPWSSDKMNKILGRLLSLLAMRSPFIYTESLSILNYSIL
jgi:hypothetical protein